MKSTLIACLALTTLSITGCKKDAKEETTVTPTKENVAGTYSITKITMGITGLPDQTVTDSFFPEACQRDDSYTLTSTGGYSINDEGTQCTTTRTPVTGDWDLTSSSKISLDGLDYDIDSFNGKQLVLSNSGGANGVSGKITFVYTKK